MRPRVTWAQWQRSAPTAGISLRLPAAPGSGLSCCLVHPAHSTDWHAIPLPVLQDAVRMAQASMKGAAETSRLVFESVTGLNLTSASEGEAEAAGLRRWARDAAAGGTGREGCQPSTGVTGASPASLPPTAAGPPSATFCFPQPRYTGGPSVSSAASAAADAAGRAADNVASGASAVHREVRTAGWWHAWQALPWHAVHAVCVTAL